MIVKFKLIVQQNFETNERHIDPLQRKILLSMDTEVVTSPGICFLHGGFTSAGHINQITLAFNQ